MHKRQRSYEYISNKVQKITATNDTSTSTAWQKERAKRGWDLTWQEARAKGFSNYEDSAAFANRMSRFSDREIGGVFIRDLTEREVSKANIQYY